MDAKTKNLLMLAIAAGVVIYLITKPANQPAKVTLSPQEKRERKDRELD